MFACIHSRQISAEVSLADFAYAFSPLVEETSRDTAVIDVEGCALRFGSPYELANQVAQQAKRRKETGGLGFQVNVALAANPDTAIYAAKHFPGVTFISPGEELEALGELAIEKLVSSLAQKSNVQSPTSKVKDRNQIPNSKFQKRRYSKFKTEKRTLDVGHWTLDLNESLEEILTTLRLWGVHTFREFATLPAVGVSERLGQIGLELQALAQGKVNRHLKLRQAAAEFSNAIELEYPISELEPLSFIFARLLNQICANLNAYALATNVLQVVLKLERGAQHEICLNLPYPMRDHKVFLKLLLLDMEMRPPPAAVLGVFINCEPVKPRVLQTGLFIPLAPEPEKLELMLARLAKLVGKENIGSPEVLDTHRPDAFRVKRFELKEKKKGASQQSTVNSRRTVNSEQQTADPKSKIRNPKSTVGFRVFRPPLRALVQAEAGCPLEISAWGKNKSVYGKVVSVAGPWRTSGDWWRSDTWSRDEWDVAVEGRSQRSEIRDQRSQIFYRLYRELRSGLWFVEGVYD